MRLKLILILLVITCCTGPAVASLTHIGYAQVHVNGLSYGLIYDSDQQITWLDYTYQFLPQENNTWYSLMNWAQGLNGKVITRFFPGYSMEWTGEWRLPDAHNADGSGPDLGYNVTGSELGYLYYVNLGNAPGYMGFQNAGPFRNLFTSSPSTYWTITDLADDSAWAFNFQDGSQGYSPKSSTFNKAIAVRSGVLVPLPGSIWLLTTGLILATLKRRSTEKFTTNF